MSQIYDGGGGGGGGMAIGDTVTGASINSVLFVDASGNLAEDSDVTFDASLSKLISQDTCTLGRSYFGSNATTNAPYLEAIPGAQNRLRFVSPGAQVEFRNGGAMTAIYYNDGTYKCVQYEAGLVGYPEDAIDIGAFTGSFLRQRFRNLYLGGKIFLREGSNAALGIATLVAGTVTVNTTSVTADSRIQLTGNDDNGGTPGWLRVSARTAGTSFTITSSSGADTSKVAWEITEPSP